MMMLSCLGLRPDRVGVFLARTLAPLDLCPVLGDEPRNARDRRFS